jgi:hypothetical protein
MKFKRYLTEEKKAIRHLEHLEDLLILKGLDGIRDIKKFVHDLYDNVFDNNSKVFIQVKIDGCVQGDTIVLTDAGEIKIKDLVNNDLNTVLKCYTYNEKIKKIELNNIISRCGITDKKWLKIYFDTFSVIVTEDHPFYVKNIGYVDAKDLTSDMDILDLQI